MSENDSMKVIQKDIPLHHLKQKGQDRNPARVLNPISYEKPIRVCLLACQSRDMYWARVLAVRVSSVSFISGKSGSVWEQP